MRTAISSFLLCLLFLSCAQFASDSGTEGGNFTNANLSAGEGRNSSWHGVMGHASISAFSSMVIPATAGNLTRTTIGTGASICTDGVDILNILFSNSSALITSVTAGGIPALDSFINDKEQDATATFKNSTSFTTSAYGTLSSVPTTYTNSPIPSTFKMGYLQDTSGNLVFIMPVVNDQPGFDLQLYDFQFMLPTASAATTNYYLSIDMKCKPPPTPPSPGGGGGGGGGGGAGAGSFSYSSLPSIDILVNLGNGIICTVNVKRSLTISKDYAVVITTLTNKGGPECTMYDFVFQDTIPSDFAQIYEVSFSPPYNSVKGATVFFVFPVFASGESRSLTYSVSRQVAQSKVQSFAIPVVLSANRGNPYLNLIPQFNQTQPGKQPATTPACIISVYCEPWGQCGEDGYHSQHCKDVSKCTDIEFFNVEKCKGVKEEQPDGLLPSILSQLQKAWRSLEQSICSIYPQLCVSEAPPYDTLCLCASAAIALVVLLVVSGTALGRKKKKERGEALEPARPPLARKEVKIAEWEASRAQARHSEYDSSLELPDERPKPAPPADRLSQLSPKLRAILEERARREEERERERKHAQERVRERKAEEQHRREEAHSEKEKKVSHPVSREPHWQSKGGLTIKPIYPEDKREGQKGKPLHKKDEK